ncbi:RAB7A-interacting MON1-CCZ1 complex subunit 1 [Discoglossus pictus]
MAAHSSSDWKQRAAQLQQRWGNLAAGARDDTVLLKASATLQTLKDLCSEKTETFNISSFLQLYSKAILDITFFEENRLVDEDFPDDSSLQKVKDLIHILSEPEHLVEETNLCNKPPLALEDDVLECLHWRRGALLYMYCHTVRDRQGWLQKNRSLFKQCLKDGVFYLLKMLSSKNPVQLNDSSFQDLKTAILLSQGMLSDIHVLALMYCGEMCYWALKYCPNQEDGSNAECYDEAHMPTLDFHEIGTNILEKYISVCEGPLLGHGWSTENAKNILQFLKKDET